MKNWRTTIGSGLNSLGTALLAIGIIPGSTDMGYAEKFKWVLMVGAAVKVLGEQVSGWAAADAKEVAKNLADQKLINRGTDLLNRKPFKTPKGEEP